MKKNYGPIPGSLRRISPAGTDSQEGATTVVMAVLSLVMLSFVGILMFLWQAYAIKWHAYNVAELSALGAADAARGIIKAQPCVFAAAIAQEYGMEVEKCEITGDLLDSVKVDVSYSRRTWVVVKASAKAGSSRYRQ